MTILITVIHVIACIILVLVVLLQAGKGADMGAVFGGASSTIFGSSGAGNFLTRLTTGAAIVFMTTSLTLTYLGARGGGSTIMPETGTPRAGVEQPADVASDTGDEAADIAPEAAGNEAAAPDAGAGAAPDAGGGAAPNEPNAAPVPAAP